MKFSEAILLGLPEIHFTNKTWLIHDPTNEDGCMGCLVGAACYAVGERWLSSAREGLYPHWPWMLAYEYVEKRLPWCPNCGADTGWEVAYACTHLAEHYACGEMTAEQIADYFRAIEPPDEPVAEEVTETVDEYQCT